MEQVVRKFRTSLGGFNRRDVMSYIEEMYAAHSKQVDALEANWPKPGTIGKSGG